MVLEFTNHLGRLTTVKRGEDSGRLQLVGRVVKKDGDNEICYLGGVILPSRRSASRDRCGVGLSDSECFESRSRFIFFKKLFYYLIFVAHTFSHVLSS